MRRAEASACARKLRLRLRLRHEDATWYGYRPCTGHIVLDGDLAPPCKRGTAAPSFGRWAAHVCCGLVATVAHLSYC